MRDLLILGGGVHGAEMVEIVERVNRVQPTWNLLGFLTHDDGHDGEMRNGVPVLGGPSCLTAYADACLLPDYEWPRDYPLPRERLVTLIDPTCFVSRTAQIGQGTVIYPNCFIGLNAHLGDYVVCLSGCIINHDDVLEDRVTLASGVSLAGGVHVEEDCYLGQACTVRQNLHIGRNSLVGMGAVVVKDVPPNSVMAGNPAQRMRER